jgi:hypothetical protein
MKKLIYAALLLLLLACDQINEPERTYDIIINEAWTKFESKSYTDSYTLFTEASSKDLTKYMAYAGMGWSQIKLKNLAKAKIDLQNNKRTEENADIYATLGFLLNAQAINDTSFFNQSNVNLNKANTLNNNWSFAHTLNISKNHLKILEAQNYFQLGKYSASKTAIQTVVGNTFNPDVSSDAGITLLANKIAEQNISITNILN